MKLPHEPSVDTVWSTVIFKVIYDWIWNLVFCMALQNLDIFLDCSWCSIKHCQQFELFCPKELHQSHILLLHLCHVLLFWSSSVFGSDTPNKWKHSAKALPSVTQSTSWQWHWHGHGGNRHEDQSTGVRHIGVESLYTVSSSDSVTMNGHTRKETWQSCKDKGVCMVNRMWITIVQVVKNTAANLLTKWTSARKLHYISHCCCVTAIFHART